MNKEYFYNITLADLRTKLISRKEELKLNYTELSAMTNVSRGTLIRFISGNNSIQADTFKKLVEWIHLQVIPVTYQKSYKDITIFLQQVPNIKHITTKEPPKTGMLKWLIFQVMWGGVICDKQKKLVSISINKKHI